MFRVSRGSLIGGALVLLLFVPGMWWGLPFIDGREAERGWAIDDETPLGALAEARHAIVRKVEGFRNPGYPLFYFYASVAAYTPYLGYLVATGQFSKPTDTYPFGLANATHSLRVMAFISKALTLLFALAVVFGAYHTARLTWNERAGRFAAVLVALMYPMAFYARTGNVDVPMLGLSALGLAAYAAIVRNGITRRRAVALGVWVGLALATKDSAVGLFAAIPLAMFGVPRPAGQPFPWTTWGVAVLAGFLALGVGSGLFVDPANYVEHLKFLVGRVETVPGTETISSVLPWTAAGHLAALRFQLLGTGDVLTLSGLVLALAGIVWFAPRHRPSALLLLSALTCSVILFVIMRAEQIRYLLPLAFVLALFAGAIVDAALSARNRMLTGAGTALFAVSVGVSVLRWADLTHAMVRDSRYDAARWLATRLSAGDRIEYFGSSQKLPRIPAGVAVQRATQYFGMFTLHDTSAARARAIVDEWQTRRPALIIVIPDHSTLRPGTPFDGSMPPSLFRALESGELSWQRAARFETPALLPWIRRRPLDYPIVNPPVHIYAPVATER